jgi:chemotaxis protein methyltransferase CheR
MAASSAAQIGSFDEGLSRKNFDNLSKYIYDYSGIKMPDSKKTMLEGRLRRRLRATGIEDLNAYCDYLFKKGGIESEAIHLIDVVTTNKTDFFREPKHFEHMRDHALPELAAAGYSQLKFWSSACSIGAEPYTIAMVAEDFARSRRGLDYKILATDLSTDVLRVAWKGIYAQNMVDPVPAEQRRKYVMTSKDRHKNEARIHPSLREKIGFARLNLMDKTYAPISGMHIIFCRNVLIYFDKKTQKHVLDQLCECLLPGGYLYVGHSETITGLDLPVRQVANTVFKKV